MGDAAIRHALFPLLAVVLAGAVACARTAPEDALRARIAALEEAIDARDAGALRGFLADDFVGPGGMDDAGARVCQSVAC